MAARPCPKCHPVVRLEPQQVTGLAGTGSVTVDVCPHCRGVWLDFAEESRLKQLKAMIVGIVSNEAWEADLRCGACPSCGPPVKLRRVPVGAYAVDRCTECEGLWFDGGELGPSLTDSGFEALTDALRNARGAFS